MTSEFEGCSPASGNQFSVADDPELVAAGWVRRFLADPKRAQEATEMYTDLGFEVMAKELTPEDFGPMCGECGISVCHSYVVVYTRKATPDPSDSK